MLVEVKVPQLPESVSEATLATWHKKEGDFVEYGQNLVDIETDKIVMELPAPQAGVLVKIIKEAGNSAVSAEVIATIDTDGKPGSGTGVATAVEVAPQAAAVGFGTAVAPVMPAAAKLAAENNINPSEVPGTGRDGRVTKVDVQNRIDMQAAKPAPAPVVTTSPAVSSATPAVPVGLLGERPEQRVPMSRLRQRVAERLLQSQQSAALLTTFNEVNMGPVMALRNTYKDRFEKEHGVKLGFMGFFIKAVVHALKKYPIVNASVDGTDIIYHGYFDIGVAVGSPRGLVVPVIRNADQLSLADIEKTIADYGARARDGKLGIEELTGGTYTISNGGTFGSMMSTPIVNPPQSAILGMHATKDRAVVEDGQVVVRPMMYLAQSYDHRIIDGREAVLSLVAIKEAIEDPARLLLDI